MKLVLILLLLIVLISMSRTEKFTESFGLSGYTKPIGPIVIKDTTVDLTEYIEYDKDVEVTNDLMQEMVFATNKEISKRTGLCTYIIETTLVKKYVHKETNQELYRCMFIAVKHKGFSLGFAVTSDIRIIDGKATVLSLATQPIDYSPPSDPSIYQTSIKGREFEDYTNVRQSEIDIIKSKNFIEKVIPEPQSMYGKIRI